MAGDKLAAGIAAAAPDAPAQIKVTIGQDRYVGLLVPKDLSPTELIALMGYLATKLPATLAAASGNPQVAVPKRAILVPS